jgi:hypothetical protein
MNCHQSRNSSKHSKTTFQARSEKASSVFKGKGTEAADKAYGEEEDDDRRIRFTIGGAGRRLTKEDFLKEIQSLDPKARCEIVAESDAPEAMKAMAQKDASEESPGSSRLFQSKNAQAASGRPCS